MNLRISLALAAAVAAGGALLPGVRAAETPVKAKCIVSGQEITLKPETKKVYVQGQPRYFCCEKCPAAFAKNPEKFVKEPGKCPVQGSDVALPEAGLRRVVNNGLWYACCPGCVDGLVDPAKLKELEDVVSTKKFKVSDASPRVEYKEQIYFFQNAETKAAFDKDPARYAVVYSK